MIYRELGEFERRQYSDLIDIGGLYNMMHTSSLLSAMLLFVGIVLMNTKLRQAAVVRV